MGAMVSQIVRCTIVYSTVYSGAEKGKHQSSASRAFVWWPVNSPHKWPVTRKMFPFDDVIMRHNIPSYCTQPLTCLAPSLHNYERTWTTLWLLAHTLLASSGHQQPHNWLQAVMYLFTRKNSDINAHKNDGSSKHFIISLEYSAAWDIER